MRSIMYENEGTVSGDEDGGLRLESPDLTGSFVESVKKFRSKTLPARFSTFAYPTPILSSRHTMEPVILSRGSGSGRGNRNGLGNSGGLMAEDSLGNTEAIDSSAKLERTWAASADGWEAKPTMRRQIFDTFNDPDYSVTAKYLSMFILSLIVLSTTTFIMDTRREYEGHRVLVIIEAVCIVVFTIEYGTKLITAPSRSAFFWGYMNLIDLVAIVPFYLEIVILAMSGGSGGGAPTGLLRLFRLFRVFRVLKLGARMKKLEVVAAAVFDSLDMMGMLVFLLVLALVLFSTLIYFCEKGAWEGDDMLDAHGGDPFASIPRSFWWCMVTLMTVGYGDAYPVTVPGKIVASITMITSVIITALPISVIGANFTQQWIVYKANDAAKAREQTMHPTFIKFSEALGAHNFVLDEVLRAVEEMEILIEQETGQLKELFTEASEMAVEGAQARDTRRALLLQFDSRFEVLQDMREELDELLAFTQLLSSSTFTSMLETCMNKNSRLVSVMDTCEGIFGEVDTLVRKVNEVTEKNLARSFNSRGEGSAPQDSETHSGNNGPGKGR